MNAPTASVKSAVHLLLYSVAFGGGIMHSYIVSPIAFKHLKREEFSRLQNKVFPLYFLCQAVVPAVIGLTSPIAGRSSYSILGASAVAGLLNYLWVLPVCQQVKEQRAKLVAEKRHEQVVDGETKPSEEMALLNKKFGMYHGFSSLFNLVSLATLGVYGFRFLKLFRLA